MVFKETTNYGFILPSKTCQRHFETTSANVWHTVQSDNKHPFNKALFVFAAFFHGDHT